MDKKDKTPPVEKRAFDSVLQRLLKASGVPREKIEGKQKGKRKTVMAAVPKASGS